MKKKLVFDDVAKADTKTLPKISPVPQPAVPPVKSTPPKAEATEVKEETPDAVKKVPKETSFENALQGSFLCSPIGFGGFCCPSL